LTQSFRYKWSLPNKHSSCQKTRMNGLSCNIRIWAQVSFVLLQIKRLTDGDYVSFSLTLHESAVSRAGHVQLLVGNVKPTELMTLSLKLQGYRQREAAVRCKKNGCRIMTRPSDRPGTDDDHPGTTTTVRALRHDAGPQNDADW